MQIEKTNVEKLEYKVQRGSVGPEPDSSVVKATRYISRGFKGAWVRIPERSLFDSIESPHVVITLSQIM